MTGRYLLGAILLVLAACVANDPSAPKPAETVVVPVVKNGVTASEKGLEAREPPNVPITVRVVADENRLICRQERSLGSHIPRRVCRTQKEIDTQKRAGQESLRQLGNRTLDGGLRGTDSSE
jgi:hypothetical protein